jgi:integrase/recombinase XerD
MKQARVLEKAELRRVLDHISTRPHAARNRCLVLMSFKCGLRAKEISSLRYQDVIGSDGTIKDEIYLAPGAFQDSCRVYA